MFLLNVVYQQNTDLPVMIENSLFMEFSVTFSAGMNGKFVLSMYLISTVFLPDCLTVLKLYKPYAYEKLILIYVSG